MLESCSSHLAGLNTVMGNTRIKVEYRGRDIIGGNKFKRIASRRKGKKKGGGKRRGEKKRGARESGCRNYRSLFSKACFARKNWRKLYERWEPASSL